MHVLIYWSRPTIIHGMRLFLHCWCIYRFIGLGLQLSMGCIYRWHVWVYWSRSTTIHGMRLILHCWCIYRFIGLGLQSSKGCVYFCTAGASIGLSVLFYSLSVSVYNYPRDASISVLPVHVLLYWSWSTIIQGMRLFLHCWCIYRFIGLGLQ